MEIIGFVNYHECGDVICVEIGGTSCAQNREPSDDLPNKEKNQYWTDYCLNVKIIKCQTNLN